MENKKGQIFLIPVPLGEEADIQALSGWTKGLVERLHYYVAENAKSARKFLKQAGIPFPLPEVHIEELNEHSNIREIEHLLDPARNGNDMGLVSEAGCPGIADPGAWLVQMAHKEGIRVVPIPGPSSIFLALMSSGFNGQHFTFNGYLPKESMDRKKKIREMERLAQSGISQIFMDTPYRNESVFQDLLQTCQPNTLLCIAADITLKEEWIKTKAIQQWSKQKPSLHKRPAIFILGRQA